MATSPIIDASYRLRPEDLEGIPRQVVIANVSYQGVEQLAPVLHFKGQSKRLVLSTAQIEQMIEITATALFARWVGVSIVLQPQFDKQDARILIKPVTSKMRVQPMPVYVSEDRRGWYLALSVVGLLLSTSIIFAALNMTTILAALQELRDNWPLR